MIKIMLVDDHRLVRAGLRRVLQEVADMSVVAEASNGEDALELARQTNPDVVLMDINMPGIGGLECTRRLLQRSPSTKVIAVSMHLEEPYPSRFLAGGAAVSPGPGFDRFCGGDDWTATATPAKAGALGEAYVGVIAAEYDALVAEESTHPDTPHAHVTLPTWHTGLLFRPETADLVAAFLATGEFPAPASATTASP